MVFRTLEQVKQVLAACGWQSNTAFVQRLTRSAPWFGVGSHGIHR